MLKFTINAKELKNLVNCVATAIDKKSYMLPLRAIYFQIDESGKLKIFGTNIEQWLEVRTDLIWDTEPGVFGIDNDDMKIILKMSESIDFEDITKDEDEKIAVKCGKRELTVEKVNNIDFFLPSMDNTEEIVLETTEFFSKFYC